MSRKTELVLVPSIGLSHVVPTVEFAKRLIKLHSHISATFLIISSPRTPQSYLDSLSCSVTRIRFISLPPADPPPPDILPGMAYRSIYVQNHKPLVKSFISQLISDSNSADSVRLIVDMFTTTMIDVAKELNIASYLYFTSNASTLGFMLYLPTLDRESLDESSAELTLPSYVSPVPVSALPSGLLDKKSGAYDWTVSLSKKIGETKGIIINSVAELEPKPVAVFDRMVHNAPRVYMVGPVLDLEKKSHDQAQYERIMEWLDKQPVLSVVFLCFGSRGTLSEQQVKEVANGLEQSGCRFLWSLRRPPKTSAEQPSEYENPEEVLPEGFLGRMEGKGLVCGWAPQVEILAHKAVGAFVSHCGWNSTLESLWFGVPLLTWPIDAEQKLNAFQLVDLGLAVDLKKLGKDLVVAEEIEKGVKSIMESESESESGVRKRVKEMSGKCRKALEEGGSSWSSLASLGEDLTSPMLLAPRSLELQA